MSGERKTAVVTGGACGIGRAIAARLLHDGWAVMLFDRDAAAGARTESELAALGPVAFVAGDVGREADVQALIAAVARRHGRLDALINNAGQMIRKPVIELALAEWERVLATNLTGAFLCAKHAAPLLRDSCGAIVNIASTRARMSEPDTEAYAASKGGLVALTHALAMSLGPMVRVNCISPGWIDTGKDAAALRPVDHAQHPAGRVGRPEDIAALAVWLVGPESGFVTGADFVVDGGMTRKMIYAD